MKHIKNLRDSILTGFALSAIVLAVIVLTWHALYFKEISALVAQ